ncbi:MAG: hypothetical protein J5691_06230 [Bacilli bacterium]|nr:hypothetical protein [Bacilli bacterium]
MDGIKEKLMSFFSLLEGFIAKGVDFIRQLLSHGETKHYIIYGCVGVLLFILIFAGLIAVFKKIPKLFVFIVFILAAMVGLAFFASC